MGEEAGLGEDILPGIVEQAVRLQPAAAGEDPGSVDAEYEPFFSLLVHQLLLHFPDAEQGPGPVAGPVSGTERQFQHLQGLAAVPVGPPQVGIPDGQRIEPDCPGLPGLQCDGKTQGDGFLRAFFRTDPGFQRAADSLFRVVDKGGFEDDPGQGRVRDPGDDIGILHGHVAGGGDINGLPDAHVPVPDDRRAVPSTRKLEGFVQKQVGGIAAVRPQQGLPSGRRYSGMVHLVDPDGDGILSGPHGIADVKPEAAEHSNDILVPGNRGTVYVNICPVVDSVQV